MVPKEYVLGDVSIVVMLILVIFVKEDVIPIMVDVLFVVPIVRLVPHNFQTNA